MKFFHISDLHIGKRVCGISKLEDQRYILNQIADLAAEHRPDGVWIAGDLYDKSMPSGEAVELADSFLYRFAEMKIPVWVISGNHDSAERIAYGGRMMEQAGIHVSRIFDGTMQKYTIDGEETVDIYLLPFVRPAQVRRFYPECTVETTQQAVEVILQHTELDKKRRNVLLMHQFLAGAAVCESEEVSVGGSDQVDASVTADFDYVALGHLHGPQKVGRETVRYCGSPLKYSFSEVNHRKSVTVVEFLQSDESKDREDNIDLEENQEWPRREDNIDSEESGAVSERKEPEDSIRISAIPLTPLHDMREIRGPIDQLLSPEVYEGADRNDYLHVTLTDQKEILDAIGRLRDVYPNIMRLDFEAVRQDVQAEEEIRLEEKTPEELFAEFFQRQNGFEMSEEQQMLVKELWSGEKKGGEAL